MKHLLLRYVLISLFLFAIFAVLSYGYGHGYAYLYWRDWQLQSSVWA